MQNFFRQLATILIAPVIILLALLVAAYETITRPFVKRKGVECTREKFAEFLADSISDNPDWISWDYFICCGMDDPELDALRKKVIEIEDNGTSDEAPVYLTPECMAEINSIARDVSGA
jgi:hypothetical protein